jgi:lipopolysaccharide/colanic/teichoic acid biosynthesis glycosyltransferase
MLKRLFDVCFSFLGLVILSPLFLIIIALIFFTMQGKVFFIQPRVGRGGNIFQLYKFRTMFNAPLKVAGVFNPGDKSRITHLGKLLRKYKLDELPQLYNVFKGDMSLVGPRPETEEWINVYPEKWEFVLNLRPGITDNASIEFRNEEDILAACENPAELYRNVILPKKLDYYTIYAKQHTFLGDLRIILRTFKIIFSR